MFDKKEKTASAINWEKIEAEELKMKGYMPEEVTLLQNIDRLEIDELRYFLKQYIHMSAMNRKRCLDFLRKMEGKGNV